MYASRTALCCVAAFALHLSVADISLADDGAQDTDSEINAETLLSRMRSRNQQLGNLAVRTLWERIEEGQLVRYEEQSIHLDDLGRIRVTHLDKGQYAADGRTRIPDSDPFNDHLYDGEKTVAARYLPNLDRMGREAADPSHDPSSLGYRTAQIFGGLWPEGSGPKTFRNPWFYDSVIVESWLEQAVLGKIDLAIVSLASNGQRQLRVTPHMPGEVLQYSAIVDASRDWIVSRIDGRDDSGDVQIVQTTDYRRDSAGTWVPQGGSWVRLIKEGDGHVRTTEKRFTVNEILVNDPDFDESVFQVSFEPDTSVYDLRFDAGYRIGEENVIDADLENLAKEALAKKETGDLGHRPSTGRGILLLTLNAVAVLVVAAVLYLRKRQRASSK